MKIINFKKENDIKKIQNLIDKRNLDNFDNAKINKKVQKRLILLPFLMLKSHKNGLNSFFFRF